MKRDERLSYLMLFCSIVVAAKRGEAIGHASRRAPLTGGASRLSHLLTERSAEHAEDPAPIALQSTAAASAEETPC